MTNFQIFPVTAIGKSSPCIIIENISIYLFTPGGSYLGRYETTHADGKVVFSLPDQEYKVSADYLGSQYWTEPFSWIDQGLDIAHGKAVIHVTDGGTVVAGASVYLFSETGSYLGVSQKTDDSGNASFTIPAKSYKFRVDCNGTRYWTFR